MTTPIAEQYVPEDFQDEIALPAEAPVDPQLVGARERELRMRTRSAAGMQSRVNYYKSKVKGASGKKKAEYKRELKGAQAGLAAAQKRETTAQQRLYEARGEYEMLLEGEGRDAFLALRTMFNQYGLGTLAPKIYDYVKQGYGSDTITLLLQDTDEYKERFRGNEARRKAGLPVLSPAEYLSVEQSYRQVLSTAGLPVGFYDNPADFEKWISQDVSPSEIKDRIDVATVEVEQFDAVAKQQLALYYGVSDKDLVAYALDRQRSVPTLQLQAAAAQFGAEAARRGLLTERERMEQYISMGLTQSQAAEGFQVVAEELPNLAAIATRFGTTFGQEEAEAAVFGTQVGAQERRRTLASQERALFAGATGSARGGLGGSYRAT